MKAPVAESERDAASTLGQKLHGCAPKGTAPAPVATKAAYPQMRPIAWPKTVFRGLAVFPSGVKNRRYAVGPSEGNTNGLRLTSASSASTPMVIKPFTKT